MENRPTRYRTSKVLATAGIALATLAALLFPAAPASAAVKTTCTTAAGDLCLYWGQNYNGSRSGVDNSAVSNYPVSGTTSFVYRSTGTGQGEYLGNNNGSARNYHTTCRQFLYFDPHYSGHTSVLAKQGDMGYQKAGAQLGNLLNNLRSHQRICP